eukprot:scaffold2162_cov398-Prasinococcus_capsulatus_cf.AAC.6
MLNEKWAEQNSLLIESHESVVKEITEEYEEQLQEEQSNCERVQQEKIEADTGFKEATRQIEEDADMEIEGLKANYEQELAQERESCQRLKGENGVMKKKFHAFQKGMEDQKGEMEQLIVERDELQTIINGLERDIQGAKETSLHDLAIAVSLLVGG